MSSLFKQLAIAVFPGYELFRIYRFDRNSVIPGIAGLEVAEIHDTTHLRESDSPIMRRLSAWGGENTVGFQLTAGAGPVAACWYWYGERYRRKRNFWPLEPGDGKLVEVGVREDARGEGHATAIIRASAEQMLARGFERLFARVWHNHYASLRAFERAGWRNVALVITLRLPGLNKPLRLEFTGKLACR